LPVPSLWSGICPKIADRILSAQALTPTSGDIRNSDSRPIGNFEFSMVKLFDGQDLPGLPTDAC
jgi:hypothetical protein